jgi:hypothetical protein
VILSSVSVGVGVSEAYDVPSISKATYTDTWKPQGLHEHAPQAWRVLLVV